MGNLNSVEIVIHLHIYMSVNYKSYKFFGFCGFYMIRTIFPYKLHRFYSFFVLYYAVAPYLQIKILVTNYNINHKTFPSQNICAFTPQIK